ncbi:MAG: murein hydrolase activator EnvC family protein [Acutalibacteraceae bacterium]
MKNKFKKALSAFLCTVLVSGVVIQPVIAFDLDSAKNEQEALNAQSEKLQIELENARKNIEDKTAYAGVLQEKISVLSQQIKSNNQTINELNQQIAEKQAIVDKTVNKISDRLDLLCQRLRAIYRAGDTSTLEIILGAKDFSDFLDKTEIIQQIASNDNKLIAELQNQMSTIEGEQKALDIYKKEVETQKQNLEKEKAEINRLSEENTALIAELKQLAADTENAIEENQLQQEELDKQIEEYYESLKNQPSVDVPEDGSFVWPCPGHTYLTSTFDENRGANNHGALDIADGSIYGAAVVAAQSGVVFSAYNGCTHDYGKNSSCGCGGGYGNYVMIDHGNGKVTVYGHLCDVVISIGDTVEAGQVIGYVGSTGYSTGPHLHFETRYNNVKYDPLSEY